MKSIFFDQKIIRDLTKTEKLIINLAQSSPEFFYKNSLKTLANKSKTSISLISNLAKKLGFDNFRDLQFHVYYNFLTSNNNKELQNESKNAKIIKNLYKYYHNSLVQTLNLINLKQIDKIIEKISKAKKIFIYGAGSSAIAASELAINLQKLGLNSVNFRDFHNFLLVSIQKEPLKILFSKSCKTREIKFILKQFSEKNDDFILITANKMIKVEPKKLILYQTLEQKDRFISVSSKINQQFISDAIFFILAHQMIGEYTNYHRQNLKILDNWNE